MASRAPYRPVLNEPYAHEYSKKNPLPPEMVGRSLKEPVLWECSTCGFEWETAPFNRFTGKGKCPSCREDMKNHVRAEKEAARQQEIAKKKLEREQRLEEKRIAHKIEVENRRVKRLRDQGKALDQCAPHLIPQIADDSADPRTISAFSDKKLLWQCEHGHQWKSSIRDRVRKNSGCPYCSGRKAIRGKTDLATVAPYLAAQIVESPIPVTEITSSSNRKLLWQCPICQHQWRATVNDRYNKNYGCPRCSSAGTSRLEDEVYEYIKKILPDTEKIIRRDRNVLGGKEIDILLPDRKIAIEVNGVFWHSERANRGRLDHKEKLDEITRCGYRLMVVWEDDWVERQNATKNVLRNALGNTPRIGARKCCVIDVDKKTADAFYDKWHVQGSTRYNLTLGLLYEDNLIMCMSFVRRQGTEWELTRMASSHPVIGGASRLIKAADCKLQDVGATSVVTFSDNSLFTGGTYQQHMGFVFDGLIPPDYKYFDVKGSSPHRFHKFGFRKKRFRDDPSLAYQEGMTERELADLNGFTRVWDYGKTRWVKRL